MHRGYVKIWRKLRDTGIIQDGPSSQFFLKAVLDAAHTQTRRLVGKSLITLDPGEFIFGRGQWASELEVSEKVLRRVLKNFEKWAIIRASKRASKYTVYKLVNWDIYQADEDAKGPDKGQQKGQQRASRGPHKKNGEEYLNTGESFNSAYASNPLPEESPPRTGPKKTDAPSTARPSRSGFMSCWQVYPIQQGQEEAWREWCRLEDNRTLEEPFAIRDKILLLAQEDDRWRGGYAPKMARWLNGKGWNDEPYRKPVQDRQAQGQCKPEAGPLGMQLPKVNSEAQRQAQDRELAARMLLERRNQSGNQAPEATSGRHIAQADVQLPGVGDRAGAGGDTG